MRGGRRGEIQLWEKAVLFSFLLLVVALFTLAVNGAFAYTDPANCTSASLNDVRVNPSQSVAWTPGPFLNSSGLPVGGGNSSLSFNGINQYVSVADAASLQFGTGDFTIELWLKMSGSLINDRLMSKRTIFTTNGYEIYREIVTGNRVSLFIGDGTNYRLLTTTDDLNDNAWHLVTFVIDYGVDAKVYVDGAYDTNTAINTITGSISASETALWLGQQTGVGGNYYVGSEDEVKIYKGRMLTPTEIAQHAQGIYLNESGLVLYLDFDGEALDQSGNGNDGTLQNGPTYTDGWASVPVSTYYNGTISVNSRRILVNSTTGEPLTPTITDTAPAGVGVYTAELAPDNSIQNGTITGFIVDQINVTLGVLFDEIEAGFSSALYATGSSVIDGHNLTTGDTLTINGVSLSWNTYTQRFEGTVTKTTPQTATYGTTVTGNEATYGVTNLVMENTETISWTTGTFDILTPFLVTGDLLGAFTAIPAQLLGASVFYTLFMLGISGAIYSYYGAERTLLVWLVGWGLFSGVVRGEAAMFGLFLLSLGGGLIMAKMWMDRRSS